MEVGKDEGMWLRKWRSPLVFKSGIEDEGSRTILMLQIINQSGEDSRTILNDSFHIFTYLLLLARPCVVKGQAPASKQRRPYWTR